MMLTKEQYDFLKENEMHLGNVRTDKDLIGLLFAIHNSATGENKPVTGCGRCVLNVKKRLKIEIEIYEEFHSIQNN